MDRALYGLKPVAMLIVIVYSAIGFAVFGVASTLRADHPMQSHLVALHQGRRGMIYAKTRSFGSSRAVSCSTPVKVQKKGKVRTFPREQKVFFDPSAPRLLQLLCRYSGEHKARQTRLLLPFSEREAQKQ